MSDTKHTPGPWDVKTRDEWEGGYDFFSGPDGAFTFMADVEPEDARLIAAAPKLKDALAAMLDFWGGYECPEVDAAIAVMQELGEDRWSMQAQMDAAKAEGSQP